MASATFSDFKMNSMDNSIKNEDSGPNIEGSSVESERYRLLFENSRDGIVIVDNQGRFIDANNAYCNMLGYTLTELSKMKDFYAITPEKWWDWERNEIWLNRLLKTGNSYVYEKEYIRKNGEVFPVELNSFAVFKKDGSPDILIGIARDITERKKAEIALMESEKRFNEAERISHTGNWEWDIATNKVYWSDELFRIYGFEPNEVRPDYALILEKMHPKSKDDFLRAIDSAIKREAPLDMDYTFLRSDGSIAELHTIGQVFYGSDGQPERMAGTVHDITDRKNAEEALLRSRTLLKTILDGIEGIVYVANMNTYEILYINKYGRDLFGNMEGKICWKSLQAGQTGPCPFCTNDKLLTAQGTPADVCRWEIKNTANHRWYDISDRAIEWETGRFVRMEIATDITERKILEKERERLFNELAEKKSELEEIIRVTSHDLRAPLVNVMGYHKEIGYSLGELETTLSGLTIPEDVKEKISSIIEQDIPASAKYIDKSIAKMDSLLSGLMSLSRSGRAELNMEDLDMGRLVKEVISTFEHQFKEKGAGHEESEPPPCFGDEKLINQVFSNLIGNALKYLDPERPGVIKISGYKEDGRVVYCVEDNGIGIAPEEQKKIFEIFHQVNAKSGGEGLGLSIVKKIAERHGGKAWVESEFGRGSRFCVSLPEKR